MIFPTFQTLCDVIICRLFLVQDGADVQIVHDGLEWSESVEELQFRGPKSEELPGVDTIQYRVLIQIFEQQTTIVPGVKERTYFKGLLYH